ncbi:hypothetical protein [Caballeronia sp. ATUFL_M1_KS5A]|uniref:hypothetical protein n=1 Tax=Caballeronia sp. ATUFL_M1_KS5A TaxID=2921778 RepID=UPI00202891E9|nr:hypothetical protein [Caballeronia sp. ATUFL_M1_KS5A]
MNRIASTSIAAWLIVYAMSSAAADVSSLITPAQPGMPLADPVTTESVDPPSLSSMSTRAVDPAYVPGLPALPQGRMVSDDFGRKVPKYDGVFIRQSRVENGEVVIPPGGLYYLEDTWGGEVALRGESVPVLGRMATYIDYDMSIVVKKDVTIPAGGSAVVGAQVYHYYASVGHEGLSNHALHVRTIAGTDWEWAFGNPVLSSDETGWWNNRFVQLYNQGQAREVSSKQLVFDWLSGVRMDRMLYAEDKVFAGLAAVGDSWQVGKRTVRVAALDANAGTVTLDVLQNGAVTHSRTLGPVQNKRLIEDTAARKALVFEDGDMVVILSPWPHPFDGGKANLKVYGKAFSLRYGQDYAGDPRFAAYPIGCPTGHGFGFMLANKNTIRIKPGSFAIGPEGYFKIAVDKVANGNVLAWHVEDRDGKRSINLGGRNVNNVDLVLGQGRVAGQAILKDSGRAMLAHVYTAAARMSGIEQPLPAPPAFGTTENSAGSLSPSLVAALGILVLGCFAVGFELGRRARTVATDSML